MHNMESVSAFQVSERTIALTTQRTFIVTPIVRIFASLALSSVRHGIAAHDRSVSGASQHHGTPTERPPVFAVGSYAQRHVFRPLDATVCVCPVNA